MPNEFSPIALGMLENLIPKSIYNFFIEGLNKRLGTEGTCHDLACVANAAAL